MAVAEDPQGVGAHQAAGGAAHGGEQIGTARDLLVDQVCDQLGVGLRADLATSGLELDGESPGSSR